VLPGHILYERCEHDRRRTGVREKRFLLGFLAARAALALALR